MHHKNFWNASTKVDLFLTLDMASFHSFRRLGYQGFNFDIAGFLYLDLRVKCHDKVKLSYFFSKKKNHKNFPNTTSKMELFATIVSNLKSLKIFTEIFILDIADPFIWSWSQFWKHETQVNSFYEKYIMKTSQMLVP